MIKATCIGGRLAWGEPSIVNFFICHCFLARVVAISLTFVKILSKIQVMPKQPGFEQRTELYKLYHYLNHYNLFGSGYRGSCTSIINSYLAVARWGLDYCSGIQSYLTQRMRKYYKSFAQQHARSTLKSALVLLFTFHGILIVDYENMWYVY